MRKVKTACVQMRCSADRKENIDKAEAFAADAAKSGARLVLLPELFERRYFCQERRYEYYAYAERTEENAAVRRFEALTAKTDVAAVVSFYERDGSRLYNSVTFVEGGEVKGVYRKTHIPDDHYYQEKFYFAPGNTGFVTFAASFGRVGVGICWDQWFPETARCLALAGAEIILYPTAIGSEPVLGTDSAEHWRRVMQGHSAANCMPVVAANRIGTEKVSPCAENGGQSSELSFYGSSFMTDNTGGIIASAGRDEETTLFAEYDLDAFDAARLEWGLFRDRRPECYTAITGR